MSAQLQVTGEAKIRDIQGPVVANSGVVTALDGAASQYVRGDGTLADFPTSTGGGSSVSYYLNSSVSQGTIGGVAYRELSKDPIIGAGTDIPISSNGYVANYITDVNDPDVILVPGGNFNCEFYFSVSNDTGNPTTYAELYKYDGTTFTLLGTSAGVPESINQGTTIAPYYFAIPVATAALSVTDRLAIRIYVNVDGRTVTLHTENGHLCQVVTTLSKGMVSLNNLTDQSQYLATGTSGTNFAIVSSGDTHTFNLPVASATNTGKLSSTDWSTFNEKVPYTGAIANVDLGLFSLTSNIVKVLGDNSTYGGTLSIRQSNVTNLIGVGYTELFGKTNILGISFGVGSIASLSNSVLTAARTYNLPDLSGTLALLEGTQTFSGAKTFSLDILVNGLTIGRGAGSISTNTAIGSSVLAANTTGDFNTAIGYLSMQINTTGYANTSIGNRSLLSNTTGLYNAAVGSSALTYNSTGGYNAALGTASLLNNTTGSNNTAVGWSSGSTNTTGSNNIFIGQASGGGITVGSFNTIIGTYTGTAGMSNNIVLADGQGNVRYQWNGTNNVFGNPISGTSASFSSSITASSLVKSGGTSSQFLMADGSVNTSVLPSGAYLPLTGGTLTGALSGTSATFSGNLNLTINTSGDINYLALNDTSWVVGDRKSISWYQGATKLSSIDAYYESAGNIGLRFSTYSSGLIQDALILANTGAATFSSSVTANGLYANAGNSARFYRSANDYYWGVNNDSNNYLNFGTFAANGTAYGTNPKMILLDNGNVGIGTSPSNKLTISNNGNAAIAFRINDTNANASFLSLNVSDSDAAIIAGGTSGIPFDIYTGGSIKMRITSGGDVAIGDTTASSRLWVRRTDDGNTFGVRATNASYGATIGFFGADRNTTNNSFYYIDCYNYGSGTYRFRVADSGAVTSAGGFFDLSDKRLKTLITANYQSNGIESITPKLYVKNGKEELGYYAQDLQEVLPSAVIEGEDGFLSLSYTQVHTAKIAHLENEIAELKELIKTLL